MPVTSARAATDRQELSRLGQVGASWLCAVAVLFASVTGIRPRPRLSLPHEKIIRDLESDLYMARRAIIELMPDPAKKVLYSFNGRRAQMSGSGRKPQPSES